MIKFYLTAAIVAIGAWLMMPPAPTTYYICSTTASCNASDSNAGTSKTATWKHAPGMANFTGSYSCNAGDQFIFIGGDTWGSASFKWQFPCGGSSASVRDYIGVDQTWFDSTNCGGSWCRPIMDCQLTAGCNKQFQMGSGTNYIQLENIEWKGILDTQADPAFDSVFAIDVHNALQGNSAADVIVDDNYIHGWSILHDSTSSGQDTMAVLWATSADTHSLFYGNYISGLDSKNLGLGNAPHVFNMLYGAPAHTYQNYCEYTANCFIGAGWTSFHDNWFNFVYVSVDSATHSNAFESDGDCSSAAYNNIISNIQTASFVQFQLEPCNGGQSWAFNNVAYNTLAPNGYQAFEGGPGGASIFFNNTGACGQPGNLTLTCGRATSSCCAGTWANELFVTTASPYIQTGGSITLTTNTVISESTATADGYTSTQTPYVYAPTSISNPTVGTGTNMTSTCNAIPYAPAKAACLADFDGGIGINTTNHTTFLVNRTTTPRLPTGNWDRGYITFSNPAPAPPAPAGWIFAELMGAISPVLR